MTAVQSGSSITITAKATGSSTNYPITITNGDFSVTDPYSTLAGGTNAGPSVYDAGTDTVTLSGGSPAVNITTAPVTWGQGDTPASLATKLASAINSAAGSYVTASANGTSVQLVSTGVGLGVNYAVSISIADTQTASYPTLFPSPSFTASGGNMSGGGAPGPNYGIIYSYMIPQGGYAPNGNILAHTDSVMGDWLFSYDAMDRLTAAAAGGSAPSAFRGQSAGWSYDSYGNRTAQSFTNSVNSSWANYNPANNQITTASTAVAGYVYDASGNTLYDGNNEYWYDAEGQLCAVQSQAVAGLPITQYIYDAEGARIGKGTLSAAPPNSTSLCAPPLSSGFTITARYLVDLGGNQVTELNTQNGTASVPLGWAHSNVFSAARLTATYDTSGLHYALADPLGTKRIQANISGQIEESCISLPFGDALSCTQTALTTADDATEHHFTQKERDSESGNDYFFARYYNSAFGRFTTPDWSAKEEPVPYATFGDPQSLNLYAYVRNNPITHVDPTGHTATETMTCTNSKSGRVCQVNIVATIAIYDESGKLGNEKMKDAASTIKSSIESEWNGDYKVGNTKYSVNVQVDVSIAPSRDAAEKSNAQNAVGITENQPKPGKDAQTGNNTANRSQDQGHWMYSALKSQNAAAHEFTHILGTGDKTGHMLSNTNPGNRAPHAMSWDIGFAVKEINSQLHNGSGASSVQVGIGLEDGKWK